MNRLQLLGAGWRLLSGLRTPKQNEDIIMTDNTTIPEESNGPLSSNTQTRQVTVITNDVVLEKVGELLSSVGHNIDEYAEIVALAKKLVTK